MKLLAAALACIAVIASVTGNLQADTPAGGGAEPVVVTMTGKPFYFHRYHVEIADVPEAEQAIYQSSWAGELGLRISGLKPEPYRVHLAYTEVDMNASRTRVFDILLNGQVVKQEVCIHNEVGYRRVLAYDFMATPQDGVITYAQRKTVPRADFPSFTLIQLYDAAGRLAAEKSAYAMRPADWEMRDYLDEIFYPPSTSTRTSPPWPGTYKIRPDETAKLTAADVVGPDGIVYPNWTQVGIPGGIPELANTLSAADFGAKPDADADSSAALQKAIDALQTRGGGVLFIPAGRYYLDQPIFVTGDNCVLRGAGAKKTRLISRFPKHGMAPEIHPTNSDGQVGPATPLAVWLDPEGLTGLTLAVGDEVVNSIHRPGLWEQQIQFAYPGQLLLGAAGEGSAEVTATASYRDGTERSAAMEVQLTGQAADPDHLNTNLGMINFIGRGPGRAAKIPLAAEAKRGDMSLDLPPDHGLRTGDRIAIVGPDTARWNQVLRTHLKGGDLRRNEYQIAAVRGSRVFLSEALRIEFPVIDGSYVQKIRPMLHSGIEDLGFEQAVQAQIHSVVFSYGWECWVRGLEIVHSGNKAIFMPSSKRCEVRDSVLDRSWYNDDGSPYVGWESSYDCLMENVTTYQMRHAPVVQWASSGNVIRLSVFHGSDMQWHAGWTNENLYEQVIVDSSQLTGAYGNGAWSSGPESFGHGPNGPRNVVYNCDISSVKTGLWMGGMNEGWLILYNRFVVGRGPAVFAKDASFDHTIEGNVFVMLEPKPAAVYLETPDCTGIDFIGNRFFGPVDRLFGGRGRPAVDRDNRIRQSGGISRPLPAVPSIYEWEQAHRAEILARMGRANPF